MLMMGLVALIGIIVAILISVIICMRLNQNNMLTIEHPADMDRVKLLLMLTEEEKERFENEVRGGLYYVKRDCD